MTTTKVPSVAPSGSEFAPVQQFPVRDATGYGGYLGFDDLLAHWRLVVVLGVLGAAIVATVTLLQTRTYTAHASFIPQQRNAQGNLGSLAAQLGVNLQNAPPGQSPQFYADLVKARDLFVGVLDTSYASEKGTTAARVRVVDAIEAEGETPELKREDALDKLRQLVGAGVNAKTGVVSLSVKMPAPGLAQQVASRLLELVNKFNLEIRQSQAAAERRFTEQRKNEALAELRQSEDRLKAFLEQNRSISGSRELTFANGRLQSDVDLRRQTYASLIQAYEQAKIDEVRDTPVITVIENPVAPARPDGRGLVSKTILGGIAGCMVGILFAWISRSANGRRRFTQSIGA